MTTENNTTPAAETTTAEAPATVVTETPAAATPAETTPAAPATPAAEAKADEWSPYEIKAPEGVAVNEAQLKEFTAFANELKIPKDKAEAFSQTFAQKQIEAVQTQIAAWREEAQADPELGGPKFDENMGVAKKALKKFGGDEVLKVLETTGLGNHKEILRWAYRVGKAMSDDVVSGQNSAAPKAEPTFASALMSVANSNKKES
jgi:hypothetical protein